MRCRHPPSWRIRRLADGVLDVAEPRTHLEPVVEALEDTDPALDNYQTGIYSGFCDPQGVGRRADKPPSAFALRRQQRVGRDEEVEPPPADDGRRQLPVVGNAHLAVVEMVEMFKSVGRSLLEGDLDLIAGDLGEIVLGHFAEIDAALELDILETREFAILATDARQRSNKHSKLPREISVNGQGRGKFGKISVSR